MHPALQLDRRRGEEEVHQHRLAPPDPAVEVEPGHRLLLEPVAAPAEAPEPHALRLRRVVVGEPHGEELQLLHRQPLRRVGVERTFGDALPVERHRPFRRGGHSAKCRLTRRFSRPFFSILPMPERPDLRRRAHVRAAAGLEVDRLRSRADPDQPHPPLPDGRLDLHRLHHLRPGGELLLDDPLRADRQTGGDVLVQPRLERRNVLGRLRHVEVETALVLADRPAGDAVGQHDRQEVQRAVHPHQPVAALPVEPQRHRLAGAGQRRPRRRQVQHPRAVAVGMDGAGDDGPADAAGVAGLAAGAARRRCVRSSSMPSGPARGDRRLPPRRGRGRRGRDTRSWAAPGLARPA